MSEIQVLKPDKDFSKEVDKQLPEAEELAKVDPHIRIYHQNWANIFIFQDQCPRGYREADSLGKANETSQPAVPPSLATLLMSHAGLRSTLNISDSRRNCHY